MMADAGPATPPARSTRGLLLLMLVGICLLSGLGVWQLNRLAWKDALIAERRAEMAAPPVALTDLSAAAVIAPYRRVMVGGTFLHEAERTVGPRTRRGAPGWHVVTPLRLDGGGTVLVNRGWVPEARRDPSRRKEGQLGGRVTVEGFLKRPTTQGYFVPDNDPVAGQWFTVDPAALGEHLGLPGMAPFWVVAGPAPNPGGYPEGGQGVAMPPNNHLQYAGTWFGLALVVAVCSVFYWRRGTA